MSGSQTSTPFDRRTLLLGGGATLFVAACASAKNASPTTAAAAPTAPADSSSPSSPSVVATIDPTAADTTAVAASAATTATPASAVVSLAPASASAFTAADFVSLGACALSPEKTAGPFPLDQQFDRRDVTEDYPGEPMRLGLRVLGSSCAPIAGAKVEIWHADSTGDYSAFVDGGGGKDEGPGTTFMRGTQTADADGIVEFLTVFAGWYSGRTPHIHVRVHLADKTVLTSQMFFDEAYSKAIYDSGVYAEFGQPDTTNSSDNIAGDTVHEGTIMHLSKGDTTRGAGTVALLNLTVDPNAVSTGGAGGPGGFGGGPPPSQP